MNPRPPASGLAGMPDVDQEILLLLNDKPDSTIELIASEIKLSLSATRQHVVRLEFQGLVSHIRYLEPGTRGRPTNLYGLTVAAKDLFPKGYLAPLLAMLHLLQRDEPEVYAALFAKLYRQFLPRGFDGQSLVSLPMATRTRDMQELISLYGHRAKLDVEGRGGRLIVTYCPLLEAAKRHSMICHSEAKWLNAYFPDYEVRIDQTIAEGSPRCVMRLTLKDRELPPPRDI
ncbi:MAG: helix-turn-helix transcriptional regulator [Dehalococcoidia bacterium]